MKEVSHTPERLIHTKSKASIFWSSKNIKNSRTRGGGKSETFFRKPYFELDDRLYFQ